VIGGGVTNDTFYAYDPVANSMTAKVMTVQGGGIGPTCYCHCIEYDPVDQVFIIYGEDFHTWAYCYVRKQAGVINQGLSLIRPELIVSQNGKSLMIRIKGSAEMVRVMRIDGKVLEQLNMPDNSNVKIGIKSRGVYLVKAEGRAGSIIKKIVF
jgi:hypothetical protein